MNTKPKLGGLGLTYMAHEAKVRNQIYGIMESKSERRAQVRNTISKSGAQTVSIAL